MLNIAICDDNKEFLGYLEESLQQIAKEHNKNICLKKYKSGREMLFDLGENIHSVDIFFLEVIMDGFTGIQTATKIRELGCESSIIFVSSSKSHVFEALDVMPIHYLIKNEINKEALDKVFMKSVNLIKKTKKSIFQYNVRHNQKNIFCEDIIFFEVNIRVVNMHCTNKNVEVFYSTMKSLEENLDQEQFVRIHKSYILNLSKISSFNNKDIICIDGTVLPIGRKYISSFKEQYSKFMLKNA